MERKIEHMLCATGKGARKIRDRTDEHNLTGAVRRGNGLTVVQTKLWMLDTNVIALFMQREKGAVSLVELVQAPTAGKALEKAEPTIEKLLG